MRPSVFTVALLISLLFGTSSLGFAQQDTLTVGISLGLRTMDPHATPGDQGSHNAIVQIYESLVKMDKEQNILPSLAESWEILDKQAIRFNLKKDVKFHNGETMTADDVVFSFNRALGPESPYIRALTQYFAGIEKVDDHTVILRSNRPLSSKVFLSTISHPWGSVLSRKAVEAAGKDYSMQPVGTGPFKFTTWVLNDRVELDRFDDYHGKKAALKRVIFKPIVEQSSRTIGIESGALDVAVDVYPIDVGRIQDNNDLQVVFTPSCRVFSLSFDITKPPYDNPKVREAMDLAIDREGILKIIFRNYSTIASGPITEAISYNKTKESEYVKRDIAKAKQLMKEAGFPNGFKGKIICPDKTEYTSMATLAQANFKEIGIDATIEVVESGAYLNVIRQQGHEPFLYSWWSLPPAPDAFSVMVPAFSSSAVGLTNRTFLKSEEIDNLLEQGGILEDGPERAAVFSELWDKINEIRPWLSLINYTNIFAHKKNLKGVEFGAISVFYLGDAYFEK